MGTQQLLLIVLGVIIVGVAIAVGITIFNNQAYNSSQQAVATELNTYATSAMQWWKTPCRPGWFGTRRWYWRAGFWRCGHHCQMDRLW